MESVPGAVATGYPWIATGEIAGARTRSLPLSVLTSSSKVLAKAKSFGVRRQSEAATALWTRTGFYFF